MSSKTKVAILQQHQENALLNTASPSPMMQNAQDIGADEILAPLDERIIESAAAALESGQTHYVDVPGIAPLREALANFLNSTTSSQYQSANVVMTAGVQESRFLTIQMIGEQFDSTIAIPAVVHPGVRKALGMRAMTVQEIAVDAQNGYLPTVDSIRQTLEGGVRLLYLESPSRLTGAAYSAEDVAAIAELVRANNAGVIWDQGLSVWTGSGSYASLASHEAIANQVATIGEAWPGMGLASWFIGYIAAPADWVPSMVSQKQIMAICTSTATQFAALEASKLFAEAHPGHVEQLAQARKALAASSPVEVIDGGAVNVLAVRASQDQIAALNAAGFNVADGANFGADGVLRLTITLTNAADEALKRLA